MTDTAEAATTLGLCALYRYFDAKSRLLYVGISAELTVRDKAHVKGSEWTQFAVGSTIERCKDEAEARESEKTAIKAERPIFNKHHNNTPEARERLRTYLEEAGRLDLLPDWRTAAEKSAAAPVGAGFPKVLNTAKLASAIKAVISYRKINVEVVAAETGLSASTITRLTQGQKPDADGLVTLLGWLNAEASTFAIPRPETEESK